MEIFVLQLILALAMFLTTAISGFFPIKLVRVLGKRDSRGAKWLSLLSCFSGGVFLATCFLDVIPHINGLFDKFVKETNRDADFPWPQFFTCIGFFLVYLVEEICLRVFSHADIHPLHSSPPDSPLELVNASRTTLDKVMEGTTSYALSSERGTYLKSITFAVAISFHSLLEGFALGVQDTYTGIMALFLSLLLHKCIEAFSVGLQVSKGNADKLKAVISTIFIYSLMTPVGAVLGAFLQESHIDMITKDSAVLVLESMAAGTFIYVLAQEKENEHDSLLQLVAIAIGFGAIALLQFSFGHEGHDHGGHSHSHSHHHEGDLLRTLLSSTLPPA